MYKLKASVLGFVIWIGFFSPIWGIDFVKVGLFAGGFAAGTVFHELGHAAVGTLVGGRVVSIEFQKTTFNGLYDQTGRQWTTLGGYMFQTAASEVIFQNKDWHQNDFALGWMALGLYTNLSNPIRFYVFGQKENDLGIYEQNGGDPAIPAILMAAYSGWTLYRMFNQTDIPLYVSKDVIGVQLKF